MQIRFHYIGHRNIRWFLIAMKTAMNFAYTTISRNTGLDMLRSNKWKDTHC